MLLIWMLILLITRSLSLCARSFKCYHRSVVSWRYFAKLLLGAFAFVRSRSSRLACAGRFSAKCCSSVLMCANVSSALAVRPDAIELDSYWNGKRIDWLDSMSNCAYLSLVCWVCASRLLDSVD